MRLTLFHAALRSLMLKILAPLMGLLNNLSKWWANKQLVDLGASKAKGEASSEILKRQDKTKKSAVRVKSNPTLVERLRKKYNIK